MNVLRIVFALALFLSASCFAQEAPDCSGVTNPATVSFVNGMFTSKEMGEGDLGDLRDAYLSYISTLPQPLSAYVQCVEFRLVHNQDETLWTQLFEATLQSAPDQIFRFWEFLTLSNPFVPDWFKDAYLDTLETIAGSIAFIIDEDIQKHIEIYGGTLGRHMVVAHSQGNFYAIEANMLLPQEHRFPVFAIATPTSEETSTYVTFAEDAVINTVRLATGALPANAEGNCELDWKCHNLRRAYLHTDSIGIGETIYWMLFPPVPM